MFNIDQVFEFLNNLIEKWIIQVNTLEPEHIKTMVSLIKFGMGIPNVSVTLWTLNALIKIWRLTHSKNERYAQIAYKILNLNSIAITEIGKFLELI